VNGELAQIICLATHGSVWLADATRAAPPALDQENSTFQYVGSLQFRFRDGQAGPESRAGTVADWLLQLRQRQAERLWLVIPEVKTVTPEGHADEHELAGFANAGRWTLVTAGGRQPEAWRASWAVGDREAPGHRIWAVRYEGEPAGQVVPQCPDLRMAGEQLERSVRSAREFAARHGLDTWVAWFDRALASSSDIPYHPDMLPAACTPDSRRVAAAAAQAWVFGGMGSWNDLWFADGAAQREYRELSRRLYAAVLQALLASANDGLRAVGDDR